MSQIVTVDTSDHSSDPDIFEVEVSAYQTDEKGRLRARFFNSDYPETFNMLQEMKSSLKQDFKLKSDVEFHIRVRDKKKNMYSSFDIPAEILSQRKIPVMIKTILETIDELAS